MDLVSWHDSKPGHVHMPLVGCLDATRPRSRPHLKPSTESRRVDRRVETSLRRVDRRVVAGRACAPTTARLRTLCGHRVMAGGVYLGTRHGYPARVPLYLGLSASVLGNPRTSVLRTSVLGIPRCNRGVTEVVFEVYLIYILFTSCLER